MGMVEIKKICIGGGKTNLYHLILHMRVKRNFKVKRALEVPSSAEVYCNISMWRKPRNADVRIKVALKAISV